MSSSVASAAPQKVAFEHLVRDIPRSGATTASILRFPWRTVAVLTVLAAGLRIVGLGSGLWIDEIYSLLESFRPPLATVLTEFPGDTQHPLYSVLANICLKLFGESAWSIRLPSVAFGVASIPMLYALGARVAGVREGLLAAALLAVSYHHVWFSQNARGYTMIAFWAILSTYMLYRGLREGGRGRFLAYGVVIGLGVFTHLTMVFLVAAQALIALFWTMRRAYTGVTGRLPDVLLGLGVGVATGALLYAPVFLEVVDFFLNKPSQLEGVSTPAWAFAEALRVLRVGLGAWIGLLGAGILFGSGVLSYARRDRLALSLFLLPGLVTLVGALLARGTMYPRFYFFMVGFVFLVVIRGAFVVGGALVAWIGGARRDQRSLALGTALSLAMIVVSAVSLRANYAAPKQDFAAAADYVEAQAGPSDVIVTTGVTKIPYALYYGRSFVEVDDANALDEIRDRGQRVWVLYTFERYIEASDSRLAAALRNECEMSRVFPGTVGGGGITVCSFGASGSYGGEGL